MLPSCFVKPVAAIPYNTSAGGQIIGSVYDHNVFFRLTPFFLALFGGFTETVMDLHMDRQTDGWTNGQTDGNTDGRTDPLKEMLRRI